MDTVRTSSNGAMRLGKEPDRATGFSKDTVVRTAYRIDQFYRWVWEVQGYTTNIDHGEADSYVRHIASSDHSQTHKSNTISALQRLFKWKANVIGSDPWEPPFAISRNSSATQPRDFLTAQERSKLRETALEYGSVPSYDDLTPEKRSRWKEHLAQRFGKPIEAISPDDWDRANGWKIPSLVWTSLDAGLRPIEVERTTIGWIDTENCVLWIPKDESSKIGTTGSLGFPTGRQIAWSDGFRSGIRTQVRRFRLDLVDQRRKSLHLPITPLSGWTLV